MLQNSLDLGQKEMRNEYRFNRKIWMQAKYSKLEKSGKYIADTLLVCYKTSYVCLDNREASTLPFQSESGMSAICRCCF